MIVSVVAECDQAHVLIIAARDGDDAAFTGLVRCYAERLFRFLRRGGLCDADADDIVQETFVHAYRSLHRYDERYAVSTWLFTIARRLAIDWHRRRRRERVMAQVPVSSDDSVVGDDEGEIWLVARQALPPQQYRALWLFYGEDLSMRDLAAVLDVSVSNAKVLVHRARARLAERVQRDGRTA